MHELGGKTDTAPELLAVVGLPQDDLTQTPTDPVMLTVVFDRPTSPGNVGTLTRSADALGASSVIITGHAADIYDPKAVRASTGSLFSVPVVRVPSHRPVLEWVETIRANGVHVRLAGTDEHGELDLAQFDYTQPTLVLVGNETTGLSAAWRDACDHMVRIPMSGTASSLNAASAASIVLYEAARQRANCKERVARQPHGSPPRFGPRLGTAGVLTCPPEPVPITLAICSNRPLLLENAIPTTAIFAGERYDVRFLEDRLVVIPCHQAEVLTEVLYGEVEDVEIGGPGLVKTGGRFAGGGFGARGAIEGMAIAAVLNGLTTRTSVKTVVRIQGTDCELFLLHTKATPEQLRIELSRPLGTIRSARATEVPAVSQQHAPVTSASPVEELTKLAGMLENGLLTREEFDQMKARLLASS